MYQFTLFTVTKKSIPGACYTLNKEYLAISENLNQLFLEIETSVLAILGQFTILLTETDFFQALAK